MLSQALCTYIHKLNKNRKAFFLIKNTLKKEVPKKCVLIVNVCYMFITKICMCVVYAHVYVHQVCTQKPGEDIPTVLGLQADTRLSWLFNKGSGDLIYRELSPTPAPNLH